MKETMLTRKYQNTDQEETIALWLVSSVQAHPFIDEKTWVLHTDDLRNKYLPNSETWIAEEDGKIIGFISLLGNYVGALFVLPEWQGKGVGSRLIRIAKDSKGSLTVGVYNKNEKAKEFYSRCGFTYESEEIQQETGEIVVNMILPAKE